MKSPRTACWVLWFLLVARVLFRTPLAMAQPPALPPQPHITVELILLGAGSTAAAPTRAWPMVADSTGVWHVGPPSIGRDGSAALYDPVRDRVLVFGGRAASGAYPTEILIYSPAGSEPVDTLVTSGPGPQGRVDHTAIYDPNNDRMVVFGGSTASGPVNEVWALSLSGTPTWSLLTPIGTPPPARSRHTAVYDSSRHYMWVFGGYSTTNLNDVWAMSLDGPPYFWGQLFPNGQPARSMAGHSAVYDAANDRMVVFGGLSGGLEYAWVWSLSFWTASWTMLSDGLAAGNPAPRSGHRAIYDELEGSMLVFGGYRQYGGAANDIWVWSLGANPGWTGYQPGSLPPARTRPAMVYDNLRHRAVIVGGWNYGIIDDAWAVGNDGRAVFDLTPPRSPPPGRSGHTVIYDPVGRRMVLYGGFPNDLWAYSLDTERWSRLPASGTPPVWRSNHTSVYDPVRHRMIVFGGWQPGGITGMNDLWQLTLDPEVRWSALAPAGGPPAARYDHSAIYDPVRDRMIVFGGFGPQGYVRDIWALSLAGTPTWSPIVPTSTPTAVNTRYGHTAIYDPAGDRMVIFGGDDNYDYGRGEAWSLLLAGTPSWVQVAPAGGPAERNHHTAMYDATRGRMVIYGGPYLHDTWALSLGATPAWEAIGSGTPPTVGEARAIYDPVGDRMVLFGGSDDAGSYQTTTWWLLWQDPVTGIPPAPTVGLALGGFQPNPARGVLETAFTLATQGRATLELFDIAGRRIAVRDVGGLGPGPHRVALAENTPVPPGIYALRLTQGGRTVVTRGVVLR
jgi:hypothetical protein